MATYTSGTTSTTNTPEIIDSGWIATEFYPADFAGGVASPNGTTYFYISNIAGRARGSDGTSNIAMFVSSTMASRDVGTSPSVSIGWSGTTPSTPFTDISGSIQYVAASGTTYYAGYFTGSAGGIETTRNTGAASKFNVRRDNGTSTGSTLFTSSQIYYVLTYVAMPNTSGTVTLSSPTSTGGTVSWSATSGATGYIVQYNTSASATGATSVDVGNVTTSSSALSNLNSSTLYYVRHRAYNEAYSLNTSATGPWSAWQSFTTAAAGPPPSISGSFADGTINTSYSSSVFASNSPTSWSRSGSLPAGLSRNVAEGTGGDFYTITGTPTSTGTSSFTLTATNANGPSSTTSFSITISNPPNPSWSDTSAFPAGKVGTIYSSSRTASDATSITNASTTAPGLSATASGTTLTLSGTPTVAGSYTVSATANGPSGTTAANLNTSVTIAPLVPPVWSDTSLSTDFRVGQSFATTSSGNNSISATNSANFSIVGGSLPGGITAARTLSGTTGIYTFTGTPTTRGSYSFVVRASNDDGNATPDQTFSGSVTHPPLWTDEALAAFSQGRSYSDAVVVSTSTAVTWSITAGSLPVGITATSSGTNNNTYTLSGTPTGSGAYSFTIQASNSDGVISKEFSGNILLVPNWTDNVLGSFVNNVEYSDSVVATNSPTYSVTAGSLPAGISLNSSTGLVSGTPTSSVGTAFSFTITATNAAGTISQAFSGTIQPDLGGGIKLFDGNAWDNKEIYVYDGTTWVLGRLYVYSGTAWIKSVY